MEKKKDYCYSRRENGKEENVSSTLSLFAAGMVLLMVCLKRASLLFLVEQQWRVTWVFLALNVVVLAILFTSKNPNNSTQTSHQKSKEDEDEETCTEMKSGNCSSNGVEACKSEGDQITRVEKLDHEQVRISEESNESLKKLSKEELNERVEAFIAMFRKHLALDARRGRDHKFYVDKQEADHDHTNKMMMMKKKKHVNFSPHQVNCFVLKVQG